MISARPRISVRNLQRKVPLDIVDLRRFAERALEFCLGLPTKRRTNLQKLREISVLIISDRRIASLNRQFLRETGPTDVITFQHGEIFISAELAREQARRFGNSLTRELRLYVVHGLLHLHGFDDRTRARARRMQQTQEQVLRRAFKAERRKHKTPTQAVRSW
jgi:probable rRNA maturation factor